MKNINISIREQRLTVMEDETPIRSYPVSTSRFGIGTEEGSMKTPTGRFRVAEKIGEGLPSDAVFKSRVPLKPGDTLPTTYDLVISRILWLDARSFHLYSRHQARGQNRQASQPRVHPNAKY